MPKPFSFSSPELLESRIAPAGVVTIELTDSGYKITGDAAANDVNITQDGFELIITPQAGTQILNKTVTGTPQGINPVRLSLYSDVTANRFGSDLTIDLKEGGDFLTLENLNLPGDLNVEMGGGDNGATDDVLTLKNLSVARNLDVSSSDGRISIRERVYVGLDAYFFSDVEEFDADVTTFYVGSDLSIDSFLDNNTDTFRLNAASLNVYGDLNFLNQNYAPELVAGAVMITGDNFAIGGGLSVYNGSRSHADGALNLRVVVSSLDVADRVFVENFSPDDVASVTLQAAVMRLNDGLVVTSTGTGLTGVSVTGDVLIVDGPVDAKFTAGDGALALSGEHLTISGNVKFASKGNGSLHLEGDGDIFGKVTASLGSATGDVSVLGAGTGKLFFDALTVTAPAKVQVSGDAGVVVAVADAAVFGKVKLQLGNGLDSVSMDDVLVLGSTKIVTGNGSDEVKLHTTGQGTSEFRGGTSINLGAGDDFLLLGREEVSNAGRALFMYGGKKFDGGSGNDLYSADPTRNVQFLKSIVNRGQKLPVVKGFETIAPV